MNTFTPKTTISSNKLNQNFDGIADGTEISDEAITADHITVEDWIAPTLQNSWADYGFDHAPAGYMKTPDGVVHLRGLIRYGSSTTATMFTLPEGYRPKVTGSQEYGLYPAINSLHNSNLACRINIFNGVVTQDATNGSTGWVSLSGISFKAEE